MEAPYDVGVAVEAVDEALEAADGLGLGVDEDDELSISPRDFFLFSDRKSRLDRTFSQAAR